MSWLGTLLGLGAASKVHDKIDKNRDDSLLEDAFEVGVSIAAGKVVKDIVDDVLDSNEEDEDDSW